MAAAAYRRYVRSQPSPEEIAELVNVDHLASTLERYLVQHSAEIDAAHIFGAGSSSIQAIVAALLTEELGFSEEVILTPEIGLVTRARPDFYFALGQGRGVLAEVERGGTVNNNHDLKDLWKAHIAPDAQHLFLIVPLQNVDQAGRGRERPFGRVCHRVGAFFGDSRREVDILSAHVFGYGKEFGNERRPVPLTPFGTATDPP